MHKRMQKHLRDVPCQGGEICLTIQQRKKEITKNKQESAIRLLSALLVFGLEGIATGHLEGNLMLVKEETFLGM